MSNLRIATKTGVAFGKNFLAGDRQQVDGPLSREQVQAVGLMDDRLAQAFRVLGEVNLYAASLNVDQLALRSMLRNACLVRELLTELMIQHACEERAHRVGVKAA